MHHSHGRDSWRDSTVTPLKSNIEALKMVGFDSDCYLLRPCNGCSMSCMVLRGMFRSFHPNGHLPNHAPNRALDFRHGLMGKMAGNVKLQPFFVRKKRLHTGRGPKRLLNVDLSRGCGSVGWPSAWKLSIQGVPRLYLGIGHSAWSGTLCAFRLKLF